MSLISLDVSGSELGCRCRSQLHMDIGHVCRACPVGHQESLAVVPIIQVTRLGTGSCSKLEQGIVPGVSESVWNDSNPKPN